MLLLFLACFEKMEAGKEHTNVNRSRYDTSEIFKKRTGKEL